MKKLFIIIMIFVLSFVSVFAYNPTSNDKNLLNKVYERINDIQDKGKLEKIVNKINIIKTRFKTRERIYYILDSIQTYIKIILDKEMADVIDDIFGDDGIDQNNKDSSNKNSDNTIILNSKKCSSLPAPKGNIITVSSVKELRDAVNTANSEGNITILIEDGTYYLDNILYITADNITFRSKSGNREKVILKGKWMKWSIMHIFLVAASDFTVADLTLGWVANHGIQIQWEHNADRPLIHNVHIIDTGEQMIKWSYSKDKEVYSDDGVVECSLLEYSAWIGPQYYIWWIDIHHGINWIVQDNIFRGIRSPESRWAEHAIHFWSNSKWTIVQRNKIINCDRWIWFGLGSSPHIGGIIKNNLIYHNTTKWDVGIGLETASWVKVYNNTIFQEQDYPNAIEYRFTPTNNVDIINNLTNKKIISRDGASANLENNLTTAKYNRFQNINSYNFELTSFAKSALWNAIKLKNVIYNIKGDKRIYGGNIGAF